MNIKLANGVVIEDASEQLVRSILGASFAPVVTVVEAKPAPSAEPEQNTHPLGHNRTPSANFDALPAICGSFTGSHRKVKTELYLVLKELNVAGRPLAPKELKTRLARYEVFAKLKPQVISHVLTILVQYGAIVRNDNSTYIIAPEVIGADDQLIVELLNSHDTADEWARIKR